MSDSLQPPWTVAQKAPLFMGFSRQEYWSGLPFPSPGNLLTLGSNLDLLHCRQILDCLSYQGSPDTVEVMNRFKGLELADRVPEELGTEVSTTVHEAVSQTIPKKKNAQWLSEEALQTAGERRQQEAKEKGKDIPN